MFDIITFGSATKDIFLQTREGEVVNDERFSSGKGLCFSLGSKIRAEDIYFTSGGGGTNTAATFAKQGFSVAYCGKIGNDGAGDNILKELERHGIDSRFVSFTEERPTSHSVILDVPEKDRTILVYRGASDLCRKEDVSFDELRSEWFYLAPFAREARDLFYLLLDHAREKGVRTMVNPSKSQLEEERFKEALSKIDILLLNMEEASILTGVSYENEEGIKKEMKRVSVKVVLITKGERGVWAYDGKKEYSAKPEVLGAKDRTGAGDSFGSGFLSAFIRSSGDVKEGIQLGIANSTNCLQKMGAKHGLLEKNDEYNKVKVHESDRSSE